MYAVIALLLALFLQAPSAVQQPVEPYKKIEISEPDVQAAAKVVLAKRKGTLISAERHSISANNLRLCLSMNRSASYEFARVVLSHDDKKKRWTVTVWSWGSCGR
jgi:hypothetical protein